MTETYSEPHVCEAEGCTSTDVLACFLPGEDAPTEYLCNAHIVAAGYCMNCGSFSAGTERFSAGLFPGFCDDCQDALLADEDDFDDDDEFDDDGEDEYPFADELDEDEE